jgi:hypothetical protein
MGTNHMDIRINMWYTHTNLVITHLPSPSIVGELQHPCPKFLLNTFVSQIESMRTRPASLLMGARWGRHIGTNGRVEARCTIANPTVTRVFAL